AGAATAVALAVEPRPKIDAKAKDDEARPSNEIVEAALRRLQRAVEAPTPAPSVRVQSPKREQRSEPKIERRPEPRVDRIVQSAAQLKIEPRIERKVDRKPQVTVEEKIALRPEPTIERVSSVTAPIVKPTPEIVPPPPAVTKEPLVSAPASKKEVKKEIVADPLPQKSISATLEQDIPLSLDEYSDSITPTQYSRESLEYDYHADLASSTSSRIDPDAQLDKLLHLGAEEFDDTARVGQRFVAALVDAGIILLTATPFAAALWFLQVNFSDPRVLYVLGGLVALAGFVYSVLSIGLVSRTVGMAFTGIHVMSLNNHKPPTLFQAAARTIGHIFSAAPLAMGFLWIVLGAERRAWHDMLSGTSVVRDY